MKVHTAQRTDTLVAALVYASRGWPVLPVTYNKEPFKGTHGVKDATTDAALICEWWERWPEANVAIATGNGHVVLDVDNHTDEHLGDASFDTAVQEHGSFPPAPTVITPRGRQLYFSGDAPTRLKLPGLPGLELSGREHYVLAPPSHSEFGNYVWAKGMDPEDFDLPPLPEWLTDLAASRVTGRATVSTRSLPVVTRGPILEGDRHLALLRRARHLRHGGADLPAILADLLTLNERCTPPKPDEEVLRIATWAADLPSFEEEYARIKQAWLSPITRGVAGTSDWKLMRALLSIAWKTQGLTDLHPGHRELATMAHLGRKTVGKAIKRLIEGGHIREEDARALGLAQPYSLIVPEPETPDGAVADDGRLWMAGMAFRGRENALRIAQKVFEGTQTPKEIAEALHLARETVKTNLAWLDAERLAYRFSKGVWGLTDWFTAVIAAIVDPEQPFVSWYFPLEAIAHYRGTMQRWAQSLERMNAEHERYDEFVDARLGVNRATGEILRDRSSALRAARPEEVR